MSVVLRFSSGSTANGLTASAFQRSSAGVGIFFNFSQSVTVANDQALFSTISAPGEFAFTVESSVGPRFRSGRQVLNTAQTDTFVIVSVPPITMTPAQVAGLAPALPLTSGSATITTLTLTLGTGSITAAGTGTYATLFGPIPISFTYVFTLIPNSEPANMAQPGFVGPAVLVRTVSLAVVAAAAGPLGWLVNFFAGLLFGLISGSVGAGLQSRLQGLVDAAVAARLAAASAPAGTIATVETLTIAPAGITLVAFGGFSLEKACGTAPTGGSVELRPRAQLAHLRVIRDRLLTRSPRGLGYIQTFQAFSEEVASLLTGNHERLLAADEVVALAIRELPIEDRGRGRISRKLANAVTHAMTLFEKDASPELRLTLGALKAEVGDFVGHPARDVLDASFKLLEQPTNRRTGAKKPRPRRAN